MPADSIVFVGIAPHPPIMVPEVGQDEIVHVRTSIDGMAEFARRVIECGAETVVLISPHAPLEHDTFVAYADTELVGDFTNFRAPNSEVRAPLDIVLLNAIADASSLVGLDIKRIHGRKLDHGTAVPLYFLLRNGWQGKVVALGYSYRSNDDHLRFGSCITSAANSIGREVALVASGDLSHRLKPGAPAGYNPEAHRFDELVVDSIRDGDSARIVNMEHSLRVLAGECGYRSMLVAFGAIRDLKQSFEVIAYEAPFGVGYMVAQLV